MRLVKPEDFDEYADYAEPGVNSRQPGSPLFVIAFISIVLILSGVIVFPVLLRFVR